MLIVMKQIEQLVYKYQFVQLTIVIVYIILFPCTRN